jgi:hypothetical protein
MLGERHHTGPSVSTNQVSRQQTKDNPPSAFVPCIADKLKLREADEGLQVALSAVLVFGPIPPLLASVCRSHAEVTELGLVETRRG